jgi:hypothetical protein
MRSNILLVQDADAVYNSFPIYCHQAKENCALFRSGDESADIAARLQSIMDRIKETPILAINPESRVPVIVTHSDLRRILFAMLYSPNVLFPIIAQIANFLYLQLDDIFGQLILMPELPLFCGPLLSPVYYPSDAQNAIMCSDKRYPVSTSGLYWDL